MTRTNAFVMRRRAFTRLLSVVAMCDVALILGGCSGLGGPVSVGEGQLKEDLGAIEALVDVPMPESAYEYVDPSEWQTGEVTFVGREVLDGAEVPVTDGRDGERKEEYGEDDAGGDGEEEGALVV